MRAFAAAALLAAAAAAAADGPPVDLGPWFVAGPFDNRDGRGATAAYPPESGVDLDASYPGLGGREVRWTSATDFTDGTVVDLDRFGQGEEVVCYLYRTITAERPESLVLLMASDDSLSVWLNGERVFRHLEPRSLKAGRDAIPVRVKAGVNHLLCKVGNRSLSWQFLFDLPWPQTADADGFVYVRRPTREASESASRAAMRAAALKTAGRIEQGPWRMIGPFDNTGWSGPKAVYPPEEELDLGASYVGADGRRVGWRTATAFEDGKGNDLKVFDRNEWVTCYLTRTITAERGGEAALKLGSDDTMTAWLNGEPVFQWLTPRGLPGKGEENEVPVALERGVNTLLLKVGNGGGNYAFSYELPWPPAGEGLEARLQARLAEDFADESEATYYAIETVELPDGVILEVGGLDFAEDGTLFACTRRGEVWALKDGAWRRFAHGLHEPLGLWTERPDEVVVAQRPEITRLKDVDGDGRADAYEAIADDWGLSGQYHEFTFGLARGKDGSFYGSLCVDFWDGGVGGSRAPYRGWSFRITPEGEFEPFSKGLRSSNGVGISPDGEVFISDNQGDYVGTGALHHVRKGDFHGHPAGLLSDPRFKGDPYAKSMKRIKAMRKPGAVLFPQGPMGQSQSQPLWDRTAGGFGPFSGQAFIGDQNKSTVMRVFLERVRGEYQGACFPFLEGFQSGNNRLAFGPDGSLWVGQTDRGWAAVGGSPYGLQRVRWTGTTPFEILTMEATREGFDLAFTLPVDPATITDPAAWDLQHYHYHYHKTYGSPQVNNTPVKVREVRVSGDGARVSAVLPALVEGKIYELHLKGVTSAAGKPLLHPSAYYTLNRSPKGAVSE